MEQHRIGFSDDVSQQLMDADDIASLSEYQKCVAVIMGDMHILEVYDKHSGALSGFTDLGNVNNLLTEFERSLALDSSHAKSLIVQVHACVDGPWLVHSPPVPIRKVRLYLGDWQSAVSSLLGRSHAAGVVWLHGGSCNSRWCFTKSHVHAYSP